MGSERGQGLQGVDYKQSTYRSRQDQQPIVEQIMTPHVNVENVRPSSSKTVGITTATTSNTTSTLSRSEHEDLCHAFALFDTEKKGEINIGELRSVLQELNGESSSSSTSSLNLERLLSSLEHMPSSKRLSLDDFVRLLTTPNQADTRDEWEKVFDLFDDSGKGHISVDDLKSVAKDLGETMEESELQAMVAPSGKVTLEQFKDIMNKKLFS